MDHLRFSYRLRVESWRTRTPAEGYLVGGAKLSQAHAMIEEALPFTSLISDWALDARFKFCRLKEIRVDADTYEAISDEAGRWEWPPLHRQILRQPIVIYGVVVRCRP